VILEVAASPDGERIVAQYAYPERRLLLVSEDRGGSWAFVAAEAAREALDDLEFAGEDVLLAADGVHPHLHVSEDGGWTWDETGEPDGSAVLCVEPSASGSDGSVLHAGTEAGLYRSDDGGTSWNPASDGPLAPVHRIVAVEGCEGGDCVAALVGDEQLWISRDGGESYAMATESSGPFNTPVSLALSPDFAADGRVWLGTTGGRVRRSADGGESWDFGSIFPGDPQEESVNDLLALTPDRLLGITEDHAVLCSNDAGESWRECSHGIPWRYLQESQSWGHYRRLEGDPDGDRPTLLASWEGLVRSDDRGATWEEICTLGPTFVRALAVSPAFPDDPRLWIGSYGSGLYETRDHGETWSVLAADQERLYAISFVPSPEFPDDPLLLMVATRKLLRSVDAGASWELVHVSGIEELHDVVLSPRFADHPVGYALGTSDSLGRTALSRTTDGGEHWVAVWVADGWPERQIEEVLFSPAISGTLYARQSTPAAVLQSTTGGGEWETITEFPDGVEIVALFALEEGGADRLVAVSADGRIWRSTSDVATWDEGTGAGQAVFRGQQIPHGDGEAPAALFLSLDPPGIARSLDAGESWQRLSTPFLSTVLRIAASPDHPRDTALVVSTHYGTFFTCDDGEQWHLLDRLIRFEDDACDLRYRGKGWERVEGEGTGLSLARSGHPGDAVEMTFSGHTARWLTRRFPGAGEARVFLDGELVAEVLLHRDRVTEPAHPVEIDAGSDGPHTLEIRVVGTGPVVVDAVEVVRDRTTNGAVEDYESGPWCPPADEPPEPDDDDSSSDPGSAPEGDCSCGYGEGAPRGASLALAPGLALALLRRRPRGRGSCIPPAPPVR